MKKIRIFHLKMFPFLVVKFSVYLNRHVFVMKKPAFPCVRSGLTLFPYVPFCVAVR